MRLTHPAAAGDQHIVITTMSGKSNDLLPLIQSVKVWVVNRVQCLSLSCSNDSIIPIILIRLKYLIR